jgi:tetratricopeptide (TPR) repeat protein
MTTTKRIRLTTVVLGGLVGIVGLAFPGRARAVSGPHESTARAVLPSFEGQASGTTPTLDTPQTKLAAPIPPEERADIFMARKSYADAVDYYVRALRQPGTSKAVVWNKLGIAYQFQVDYRNARKSYKQAAKLQDDYAEPWNNLGTTYFLQGKFRSSVRYYMHAIAVNPSSASFHMNLGASYTHMKKYPEAVDQYRQALILDPNVLSAHSANAPSIQAHGADKEFYFYMAKVFASLGRVDESLRYLKHALEDGFKDFKRLDDDPDFAKMSQVPEYIALRKNPPVAIPD